MTSRGTAPDPSGSPTPGGSARSQYAEDYHRVKQTSKRLVSSIDLDRPREIVRTYLNEWSQEYQNLFESEMQYRSTISPSELDSHDRQFHRRIDTLTGVREEARRYLDSAPSSPGNSPPRTEPAASDVASVGESELCQEIRRLEREIADTESRLVTVREKKRAVTVDPPSVAEATSPVAPKTPVPAPKADPNQGLLEKLVDLLSTKNCNNSNGDGDRIRERRHKLGKMEPKVYSGDMFEFPLWLNSFEALVEEEVSSAKQRLYFLGHYTSGHAYDTIKNYLGLKNDDAFPKAKQALVEKFGDHIKISDQYKQRLRDWPQMKKSDPAAMRKYAEFLMQCKDAMQTVGYLDSLDNADENVMMARKLPTFVADRWNRIVQEWRYGTEEKRRDNADYSSPRNYPPFGDFCQFVYDEARVADGPCNFHQESAPPAAGAKDFKPRKPKASVFATTLGESSSDAPKSADKPAFTPKCLFCKNAHFVSECSTFLTKPYEEKKAFALRFGLCFGCLRRRHTIKDCRQKNPALMNAPTEVKKSSFKISIEERVEDDGEEVMHSTIVPVVLQHRDNPDLFVTTYAVLDTMSNCCLVKPCLLDKLDVSRSYVDLELTTLAPTTSFKSSVVFGLTVRGLSEPLVVDLPRCYTKEQLPVERDVIPRRGLVKRWDHLKHVAERIPEYSPDMEIGLLIGYNCPTALTTREWIAGANSQEPVGVRTPLGWSVMGTVSRGSEPTRKTCFRTSVREEPRAKKEVTPDEVKRLFDFDFHEAEEDKPVSQEDVRFMKLMESSVRVEPDGHYSLPLPFKRENVTMPDNRGIAEKKFFSLRKRLSKDDDLREKYMVFMKNLVDKQYAERVEDATAEQRRQGKVCFVSHHAVRHPKKPDKVRGVFNYSEKCQGRSLNEELMTGPDFLNSLPGVLCRFREEPVAVQCDIEAMFYQVRVHQEDRDYLRFLWVEGDDLYGKVVEYRMRVHPFGAASSPGCANFALLRVAEEFKEEFPEAVVSFVKKDFYMDDGLRGKQSQRDALNLIEGSHTLCLRRGFYLHKYLSNDVDVLEAIPAELRAKGLQSVEIQLSGGTIERSLGLDWFLVDDVFKFRAQFESKPLTRRTMLSCVSSVFDPLGFLSPVILRGKRVIQQLCQEGKDWDEPVSEEIREIWNEWRRDLEGLESIVIPRCVKEGLIDTVTVELHHFSDASTTGFGQCSYLRLKDSQGQVSCNLVMAKAKVGPSKQVTVPRLELQSAVLSTRVSRFLNRELSYPAIDNYYWTDSMITLGYINNSAKRFHVYVANRVQQIQNVTQPGQWRHVATHENPADLASRGVPVTELATSTLWWKGPEFLNRSELELVNYVNLTVPEHDAEVKPAKKMVLATQISTKAGVPEDYILTAMKRYSSWYKIVRLMAYWIKFKTILRQRVLDRRHQPEPVPFITVVEKYQAAISLIRVAQQVELREEYEILLQIRDYTGRPSQARDRKLQMKTSSNLYRLDPYLDEQGLIRVGGRVRRSDLPRDLIHPKLIPKRHHLTDLLLRYIHERAAHPGRGTTLSETRSLGYWIIGGRSTVAHYLSECVVCREIRGKPAAPKMADLPSERVNPAPPFTYCGMDVYGPYEIKTGRVVRKRWIIIFTCLVMRGVHLEILHSLTTDSFLNAYRRFVARRGPVRLLRSDQGTNFVGARNELRQSLRELDHHKLSRELNKLDCDFADYQFNPPHASHMGGVWERLIASGKRALNHLLTQHCERLEDELFLTLVIESEALLNSRPLTYLDLSSVDSGAPLTPQMLLTLKEQILLPLPGNFVQEDLYCRKRWRCVQYLVNQFWYRWQREYLPTLSERRKWQREEDNLQENDVVLIVDENAHRNKWSTGRVSQTYPSDDGQVRKVDVIVGDNCYERPAHKLILLFRPKAEN